MAALAQAPGVQSAAVSSQLPMGPGGNSNGLIAEAATIDVTKAVDALLRLTTPDYLKVMRIPLVRGRGFGPQDGRGAPRVMIVSQELARRLWPGQDPIGKRVACCEGSATDPMWKTVIGVAGDVRSRGLGRDVYPEFYLPLAQSPAEVWDWLQRSMAVAARSASGDAAGLSGAIRAAAREAAPGVPLYDVTSMEERLGAPRPGSVQHPPALGARSHRAPARMGRDLWRDLLFRRPARSGVRSPHGPRGHGPRHRGC